MVRYRATAMIPYESACDEQQVDDGLPTRVTPFVSGLVANDLLVFLSEAVEGFELGGRLSEQSTLAEVINVVHQALLLSKLFHIAQEGLSGKS